MDAFWEEAKLLSLVLNNSSVIHGAKEGKDDRWKLQGEDNNKQHLLCAYGMPDIAQNAFLYDLVKSSQKLNEESAMMTPTV